MDNIIILILSILFGLSQSYVLFTIVFLKKREKAYKDIINLQDSYINKCENRLESFKQNAN